MIDAGACNFFKRLVRATRVLDVRPLGGCTTRVRQNILRAEYERFVYARFAFRICNARSATSSIDMCAVHALLLLGAIFTKR